MIASMHPECIVQTVLYQYSLLHCACEHGQVCIVQYLIDNGLYDEMILTMDGASSPLHLAVEAGHLGTVNYLLDHSPCNPMLVDEGGDYIIHTACQDGNFDMVKCITKTGKYDQNIVNSHTRQTPLHIAARQGHLNIVQYLVEETKSDPACVDDVGRTPLYLAVWNGRVKTVQYLASIFKSEQLTITTREKDVLDDGSPVAAGKTPLHAACLLGHYDIVCYLVEKCHYSITCSDVMGNLPLHSASAGGKFQIIKYLIEKCQCDPMSRMCDGKFQQVPLHFAAINGHLPIAKYLIEVHGCDPMCHTNTGHALIHLAAENGHFDTVKYLIEECQCEPMSTMCDKKFQHVPLHFAAIDGHLPIAKYLIEEHGCDPMYYTNTGCAPIHLAAENGHFDILEYLIEECQCAPMCLQHNENFQYAPIHFAARNGHLSIAKYLIEEHGCDPMCYANTGCAPIHLAAENGHFDIVEYLIEECQCAPMYLQHDQKFQYVSLHFASRNGHLRIAKYLIEEHGCDPMCHTNTGHEPLHLASQKGHFDTVKYLIEECQCEPMSTMCDEKFQQVPLHFAARNGHLPITKYLIEVHGCDPMCHTNTGHALIHLAAENGHFDTVKYLIEECQCEPMTTMCDEKFQQVPLHFAAINGHLPIVKYLIEVHGCDPMCHTNTGCSPLHLAAENGHFDTVKYLIEECQCEPMSTMCNERYRVVPLHFAAINGHLSIAKYLIEEHGCDPMCQTRKGFVALHLATLNDHFDIVEYLIEEQGCDPMFQSKVGKTALHYAAERQDIKLINYLLLRGADPNILSSSFLQFTQANYPFLYCYHSDLPLAGTKVFVVGNQGAGKSSLVESLKQERRWLIGRFTNVQVSPETTGIISHLCSSNYFGDIMLYDFAGHPVYYASHSVLIQNSTNSSQVPVFVLVLDLLLSTADFSSQLEYWVSFLRCTCSASIVLVIAGSHYDAVNSLDFQTKMAVIVKFKETIKKTELNIHFVPLDCRKAKSNGIDKIRGIISQLCKGTRGKKVLCTFHYMLLSVFKWSFGNEVAFQLSDAIEMLRHTNIPLPYVDEDYVFSLCEDLCAMSCILFLKSKTPSKCWIALDQSKVLHEIQRFKLDQNFVNAMKRVTTGIVPHSLLLTNFPTYNLDFVIRYMLEMEYFQLIDDGVLGKVSSDEPHYFFPD